jgi:hypothetical protein
MGISELIKEIALDTDCHIVTINKFLCGIVPTDAFNLI